MIPERLVPQTASLSHDRKSLEHSAERTQSLIQRLGENVAWLIALLCPIIAIYVSGDVVGASDLLMPGSIIVLLLGRRRGKSEACYWALAIFLAVAMLSLLQISDSRVQFRSTLKWIRLVGICLPLYLGLRLVVTPALIRRTTWALFWGGLVAMAIALVIYVLQIPVRTEGQKIWFRGGSFYRAGGLIGETTAFGHLVATWATLCFGLLVWHWRVNGYRMLAVIIGVCSVGMIFAASSRAALLNMLVFMMVLYFVGRIQRSAIRNFIILSGVGMVLLAAMITLIIGARSSGLIESGERIVRQFERFTPGQSADQFSSGRVQAWQRYAVLIRKHIFLGCGYKTATRLLPGRTPDNSILSALLETGVFGLVALVAFGLLVTIALLKRGVEGDAMSQVLAAAWCGQLVQALTNDTYTLLLGVPVLYLLSGFVLQHVPEHASRTAHVLPNSR